MQDIFSVRQRLWKDFYFQFSEWTIIKILHYSFTGETYLLPGNSCPGTLQFYQSAPGANLAYIHVSVRVINLCYQLLKDKLGFAQTLCLCLKKKKNQSRITSGLIPALEYWVRRAPTESVQLLWTWTIQLQNITAKPCNITHMQQRSLQGWKLQKT